MTDRKIFGPFSSAQVTLMVCAAFLAPGAVYATASLAPVVITEPGSGKQSYIDGSRRLYTYDPIAGYANNPANIVNITNVNPSNNATVYTVPTGKALIIKSASITYYNGTVGSDNYVYIESDARFMFGFDSNNNADARNFNFEGGIIIHSGAQLYSFGSALTKVLSIEGYLVPSGAVPALATQEAAEQLVTGGQPLRK